ncbi:MAG: GNAT family N-acetyltransferase [Bauldia sp.]|nr:GNAT family N-acetyltransferase [Bauldia sp.]
MGGIGLGLTPPGLSAPVPLSPAHNVTGFVCGVPVLDEWLRERALRNEGRYSRTYVVALGNRVIAYHSVSAGAVERVAAPGRLRRNAPDSIPVSIIGRLAVALDHAGSGLGTDILADALYRIAVASESIGIGAVLVHAKDERARHFYLGRAEFIEYPADSRILFLPIETVVAAFR